MRSLRRSGAHAGALARIDLAKITWGHEGIMNSATQRSPWEIASPDAGSERFFATGGAVLKSDATRSGGRPFQDGRPFLYNKYTPAAAVSRPPTSTGFR